MKTKIRQLWDMMLRNTRKEAIKAIIDEPTFSVSDEGYIKQWWIYKGAIPEDCQERTLEIFQESLKNQAKRLEKVIS